MIYDAKRNYSTKQMNNWQKPTNHPMSKLMDNKHKNKWQKPYFTGLVIYKCKPNLPPDRILQIDHIFSYKKKKTNKIMLSLIMNLRNIQQMHGNAAKYDLNKDSPKDLTLLINIAYIDSYYTFKKLNQI